MQGQRVYVRRSPRRWAGETRGTVQRFQRDRIFRNRGVGPTWRVKGMQDDDVRGRRRRRYRRWLRWTWPLLRIVLSAAVIVLEHVLGVGAPHH